MTTDSPCLPVSMPYSCSSCNRSFKSLQGVQSHCNAKRHRFSVSKCHQCDRQFMNDHALQQHRQDSPHHRKRNNYKPYHCATCTRSFGDQSALNQHYRTSSAHLLQDAKCPFCPSYFTSPSAVAHHVESGCHGITRHQVTHAVKCLDVVPNICITQRIEGASPTPPATVRYYVASLSAFNGRAYACFLCRRMFRSLHSLSAHLNSAAHDANEFKCPKCKKRFKLVSALMQHIESAACKLAQLPEVQKHFQGLTARFSRLITM
ncbi:hypothetical protein BYT27DRAFT_7169914 [Phlegmacium glaucopus]|nr:hypothetical protein BYT27DRAFT_7169914 [Phlegmacium glaucopus]